MQQCLPPLEKQRDHETNQRHAVEKEASKEGFESIDAMLEMQFERIHGQYWLQFPRKLTQSLCRSRFISGSIGIAGCGIGFQGGPPGGTEIFSSRAAAGVR